MPRALAWFSCGAASAVAAYLTLQKHKDDTTVVYCDLSQDEHPDNQRFLQDVQEWLGVPVTVIKSTKYSSVEDVFDDERYMSGVAGAPCTVAMKKIPRHEFQELDDIHAFGYTKGENRRVNRLIRNNPELTLEFPLMEKGLSKKDCFQIITEADIELPAMYQLGYKNNNCIGCVKASSAKYWNQIRRDFPDVFQRRAAKSRELGVRLANIPLGKRMQYDRVFLDELPSNEQSEVQESLFCGPECGT